MNKHYENVIIHLIRESPTRWRLEAREDGKSIKSTVMFADEATAMARATTLAGWFDAELVVEKVGLGEAKP